jgi:DUF4097 and DUF4098 domain-containing protein YvlB
MNKTIMKILGAALLFLLAGVPGGFGEEENAGGLFLVNTLNLSLAGVETLSISYGSDDVILRESETGELIVKEYMKKNNPRYYAEVSRFGGTLRVKSGRRPWLSWHWEKVRAEIYLPRSFRENLRISNSSGTFSGDADLLDYRTIDISVSSGSVFLGHLSAKTVSLQVSSGELDVRSIGGDSFISVSSGKLQIDTLSGAEHRVKVSSGHSAIESVRGKTESHVSSGALVIGNFSGEGSFEMSSGNISLGLTELLGDLRLSVSSGGINMTIPGDLSFNLDGVTRSGSILVDEDRENFLRVSGNSTVLRPIGSSPERTIYARTSSGTVNIRRD